MKRTRITLARVMVVVAVIAVDLAAFIVGCRSGQGETALGLAPTGVACQIGLLCAVLSRGGSRAFWTGFVVFGCAMMATFLWAGEQQSAANEAWTSYVELAEVALAPIPNVPRWVYGDVGMAAIYALPQLAVACAGGVFASLVAFATRRLCGASARDLGLEPRQVSPPHSSAAPDDAIAGRHSTSHRHP